MQPLWQVFPPGSHVIIMANGRLDWIAQLSYHGITHKCHGVENSGARTFDFSVTAGVIMVPMRKW